MEKYKPAEKKSDIYDIGDGLIVLNIQTKTTESVLDRVDTYIGMDGIGFCPVGVVENISSPGYVFSYPSFVRMQSGLVAEYKRIFWENLAGNRS